MKSFYLLFAVPIVCFGCSSNRGVEIPDANLAAAVRKTLKLNPTDLIPQKKLEELEHLVPKRNAGGKRGKIFDLTGLEKATGLNTLELHFDGHRISDITPLAKLKKLKGLNLNRHIIFLDVDNKELDTEVEK